MRRGDLDATVERGGDEGGVKGLHRRDQISDEEVTSGGDNFVSDEDADDVGCWEVRLDVIGDPLVGEGEIGEVWDLVVGDGDGDGNTGVSEGSENLRICVEESNAVNDGGMEEELRHFTRRRQIVGECAVVYTNARISS